MVKFLLFLIFTVTSLVLLATGLIWYLSATTELSR
jgi:hypothetical protein